MNHEQLQETFANFSHYLAAAERKFPPNGPLDEEIAASLNGKAN
jgi:hypothetical protein